MPVVISQMICYVRKKKEHNADDSKVTIAKWKKKQKKNKKQNQN